MVDISDPIVLSTVVQTIVLSLTLIIFALSFRSQDKAIKDQGYQKVLDDYSDIMRTLSERPELHAFQLELINMARQPSSQDLRTYTREEMIVRNYVVRMYGFFERLHSLYKRKWISEDEWKQWAAFLEVVAVHPVFRDVHRTSGDMWDKPFEDYVDSILDRKHRKEQKAE